MGARARTRFTEAFIRGLKPSGKLQEYYDADTNGLTVLVTPGGVKSFYLRYASTDGKRRRLKIGRWPAMNVGRARAKAREVLGAVATGSDPVAEKRTAKTAEQQERKTLKQFLDSHFTPWAETNLKSGKDIVQRIRKTYADLLDLPLADISPFDIERIRAKQVKSKGRRDAGNRDLANLKSILNRAVLWGHLEHNPAQKVRLGKRDAAKQPRALTQEETQRLLEALDRRDSELREKRVSHYHWLMERNYPAIGCNPNAAHMDYLRPLVYVALHCGLRRSEMLRAEWRDLDFEGKTWTVRGEISKSSQSRIIPLNRTALESLRGWAEQHANAKPTDPVFTHDGTPLKTVTTAWRNLCKAAKIEGVGIHTLRHTFASRLVESGADLQVVRALLGHSSLLVTSVYAHASDTSMSAAVNLLAADSNLLPFPNAQGEQPTP